MTDLHERCAFADLMNQLGSMQPAVVGTDLIFEGYKDAECDNALVESLFHIPNLIVASKLVDYNVEKNCFTNVAHSYFESMTGFPFAYVNIVNNMTFHAVRKYSIFQRLNQDTIYSLGINMIKTIDSSGNIIKIEKITKDGYRGDSVKEIQLYNVGILESEVTYKNGILDGLLKFYYEDGTICREATYKEGKLNGISIDYSENGYPYRMATFKNGELFGRQVIYNENFEIESEWYIYKDIKLLKPIEKPLEINNKNDSILIQKPIISEDTIKTI